MIINDGVDCGFFRPFRSYNPETDTKSWEAVTQLTKSSIYMEGTVNQLIELTGWSGKSILYFGDQIYADLADITLFHGWRTGAIITELEVRTLICKLRICWLRFVLIEQKEIWTLNSETFREAICELQAIQTLIDEEQKARSGGQSTELMDALLDDRNVSAEC